MTKQHKNKPETDVKTEKTGNGEGQAETQATDINAPTGENEPTEGQEESAEQKIAELNKKYTELNEKYLRLYSEFDNFRKRALKERIELSKTATEDVITELLPVLDDFERAIVSFDKAEKIEPLKEGTNLIYNKFKNTLQQKGLQEAEAMGQVFDTDFHEAIANIPSPSEDMKNKILDVTQKGYLLNGKVIRFAKVVVGN
ncbi:MAG: nucleotide exchange factor GrpE [Lentimicrobiaceae bacterium]|nr:nucleotide exchange factor GrpE [Lentimicrobiaceae bacterium]MCO5264431.1 nucleotide exchange factor GrpE [Lentimicrobium sp.]